MKVLIFLLFSVTVNAQLLTIEDATLDPVFVKRILQKELPNEIILKERMRRLEPGKIKGEIRGHKVGNGLIQPTGPQYISIYKKCSIKNSSDLEFLLYKTDRNHLVAVLTQNREETNLAEFLEVKEQEILAGFSSYRFISGHNPLRGEMFQIEWSDQNNGILRIVFGEKLHHFGIFCQ